MLALVSKIAKIAKMSWSLDSLESTLLIGSTLVEGSTLSEHEAKEVLAGRTVSGHSVYEVRELLNYRSAVEWLMAELASSPYLSCDLILGFHRQLFRGFPGDYGRWKSRANFTYRSDGSRFEFQHPALVGELMQDWVDRFNESSISDAAIRAAELYYEFQRIHPFEDGNGRIGRVLLAYWLHWKWNKPFSFYQGDKLAHLEALESANQGNLKSLAQLFQHGMERAS